MVKCFFAVVFVALFALPALAQDDDYPPIEIVMGYGNMGFKLDTTSVDPTQTLLPSFSGRHSGFVSQQGFNFTRWLGVENFFGYYGLGNNNELLTNIIGGKVVARKSSRIVPYAVAGIGGSSLRVGNIGGSTSGFATRLGAGVDVPVNSGLSVRFDLSRISSHVFNEWVSGSSFSTGVVINLGN